MKKLLIATATAVVLGTGSAMANDTLDTILASDYYAGATVTETSVTLFGIKVEATLADGTVVENSYRLDGSLRKSEVDTLGVVTETVYSKDGSVVRTETSATRADTSSSPDDDLSSDTEDDDEAGDDNGSDDGGDDSGGDDSGDSGGDDGGDGGDD